MRISLHYFAAVAVAVGWTLGGNAQTSGQQPASSAAVSAAQPSQGDVTDPLADSRAVVVMGKSRFTVLTPELIRMEWSADGKFEDHASFVFLNRKLSPVPFDRSELDHGHKLVLKTSALTLTYAPGAGQRSHQDGHAPPFGSWRTSPARIRATSVRARSTERSIWPQKSGSER